MSNSNTTVGFQTLRWTKWGIAMSSQNDINSLMYNNKIPVFNFSRYLQYSVFFLSLFFPLFSLNYILILILYSLIFIGGHLPYIITIKAN